MGSIAEWDVTVMIRVAIIKGNHRYIEQRELIYLLGGILIYTCRRKIALNII